MGMFLFSIQHVRLRTCKSRADREWCGDCAASENRHATRDITCLCESRFAHFSPILILTLTDKFSY